MAELLPEGPGIYGYVGNIPTVLVDVTGEIAFVPILVGIGAGFAFDAALNSIKKRRSRSCPDQDTSTPLMVLTEWALWGFRWATGPFDRKTTS